LSTKEIELNRSRGQAPKRTRRTSVCQQVKHLKKAGVEVTRVIVEPDGRQIIEFAGAADNPSSDKGGTIVL
jgi:hypothetical protein